MYWTVTVNEYERGLDYLRGRFVGVLEPGRYRAWSCSGRRIAKVDLRETGLQITGQELLTSDRAAVRLNMLVRYRIADPALAMHGTVSYMDALYQVTQLTAREAVATRDLETVLTDRAGVNAELTEAVTARAPEYGLEATLVALKDVIVDPALRAAYQAKLVADQQGQAKLVEARHMVAVARMQANTAKVLAENPALLAQQQLEILGKAAERSIGNQFLVLPESLAELVRKLGGQ